MRRTADALDEPLSLPRPKHPRRERKRAQPWLRRALTCAGMVAGLTYLALPLPPEAGSHDQVAAAPVALTAPPPAWQPVAQAAPLYALEGGDASSISLEVHRHANGGREDALTVGSLGAPGFARLRFTRGLTEPEPASFYLDLVRQAAQAGLAVVRSTQGAPFLTKFGPAEAASVTVAGGSEEACLAFRLTHPEVQFSLRGWLCGAPERPVTEAHLACLIDRVTLAGREDQTLKVLFAQAERQRMGTCEPSEPRVAAGDAGPPASKGDRAVVERAAQPSREARPPRTRRPEDRPRV